MSAKDPNGASDPYSADTDSAIRYFPVFKEGDIIGYLWASENNDGISFIRRLDSQHDTLIASVAWSERLDQAEEEGLTPLQAMHHWAGKSEDPEAGGITADTPEHRAASLQILEEMANPGHMEQDDEEYDEATRERSEGWDSLSPLTLRRPGYRFLSENPVRYLPVTRDGRLLGYLWASDTEDAADFVKRTAAGANGTHAQGRWIARLRQAKDLGLTPLQALHHWTSDEDPVAGRIPPGAEERIAANVQELEELVNRDDHEDHS